MVESVDEITLALGVLFRTLTSSDYRILETLDSGGIMW